MENHFMINSFSTIAPNGKTEIIFMTKGKYKTFLIFLDRFPF